MKDNQDPTTLIHSFQKEYDVRQIKAGDLYIWPIVLFELKKYADPNIINNPTSLPASALKELLSFFKRHVDQFKDIKNTAPKNRQSDIVFLTPSTRRVKLNGTYYDRICDPFVDALEESGYACKVFEWSYDHQYRVPRYNPSIFIQDQLDIAIARGLINGRIPPLQIDLLHENAFAEILERLSVDQQVFIQNIKTTLRIIFSVKSYFNQCLKKNSAQYAFYYPYYGTISFAFALACKSNNIYTVEVPHGYYGEHQFMRKCYRNLTHQYDLLPDAIWCWEKSDAETVFKWGENKNILPFCFVGGNLWNNIWKYPQINNNQFYENVSVNRDNFEDNTFKILLTLSPIFNIPDWLGDAMKTDSSQATWLIRFHHNTGEKIRERYMTVFSTLANAEYDMANSLPLPMLLRMSDIHVTINSSCTAEAAEFGVKSIITGETGITVFKSYVDTGWALPALSKKQFHLAVDKLIKHCKSAKQCDTKDHILSNSKIVQNFISRVEPEKQKP